MKLKRLLTGVLSAVMALSVCAMPALAAENNAATPTTGSLTITKYEVATGKTSEDYNNKRGEPLQGVEFTIYKVADVKQSIDSDGKVQMDYELVKTLADAKVSIDWENYKSDTKPEGALDSKKLFDEFKKQIEAKKIDISTLKPAGITNPQTTGSDGKAKFENLPCGIYMVEETNAPEQVVSWSASFLVSIPTMNATNNGWLYDVKVEPKNTTAYGGVTLVKYGAVAGSKDNKTLISGAAFLLERKKNDNEWEPVDLTAGKIQVEGATDSSDLSNGKVTMSTTSLNIQGLAHGTYRFTEISAPDGYVADTLTKHEFVLDEQGNITGKDVAVGSKSLEITNERPDFDKDVTLRGENGANPSNDADYGIGDLIPYTLTVKVPETIANLKTFYVTDSINTDNTEQLAYEKDTFKVSCSDTVDIEKDVNYTITFNDDGSGFKIDFKPDKKTGLTENFAGKTITITYKAKLQSGAYVDRNGNINKAELIYSNKTNTVTEDESKDIDKIHDEAVVYTFQTSIMKTGSDNAKLDGVKFDLYKKYDAATDGTITDSSITFRNGPCPVIDGEAAYKLKLNSTASSNDKWILVKKDMTTAEGGAAIEKGLPKGDYYLVETETKPGYNLLSEPVKADLSIQYAAKWTESKEYTDGVLTKHTYDKATTTFDDAAAAKIINIVNRAGFTLPVTGGFGTLLFSGIGVLLVLAGVCVLFSMKKKNNRA